MKHKLIDKHSTIEFLTNYSPSASTYLIEKGIRNLHSSENFWGTLEMVCLSKGYTPEDIDKFVRELNEIG
jgi:hypothetical protein